MSRNEIGLREARQQLGDLVTAAQYGRTTVITRNGRPAALITPIPQESAVNSTHTLTIVRGEQPAANGEEFGLAGIKVSDEVYDWFAANGVSDDDPDVWVLVTPADEQTGAVNVIASRDISADTETTYERTTDEGTDRTVVIVEHGDKYVSVFERHYTDGEETNHGCVFTGPDTEAAEFLRRNALDLANEGYREV